MAAERHWSISGLRLGTPQNDLPGLGWELEAIEDGDDNPEDTQMTVSYRYRKSSSTAAVARQGVIVHVQGPQVELNGVVLFQSGQEVSADRAEIFRRIGYAPCAAELDALGAASHQRLNFEGAGVAIIIHDNTITTMFLDARLLAVGLLRRRIFGTFYDVTNLQSS